MPSPKNIRIQLIDIAEPVCDSAGYELVDLRYVREGRGWVVRVFIDRQPGSQVDGVAEGEPEPIGFDDCERVSRELSAVFDVEDPLPEAYHLEVSSPGVERPLRTLEHFERFSGRRAKVALEEGVDGRRNFTGTLRGTEPERQLIFIEVDQHTYELPIADVRTAKLIADWDAFMAAGKAREAN